MSGLYLAYLFKSLIHFQIILWGCISLFLLLFCINIYYKRLKAYRLKPYIGLGFTAFCFLSGLLISLLHEQSLKSNHFAKHKHPFLKGWIANEPEQNGNNLRFIVNITSGYQHKAHDTLSGKLSLILKLDSLNPAMLNYGDELMLSVKHSPIEAPYYDAAFNFKAWMASKNIYHQAFLNQNQLQLIGVSKGNPIITHALKLRQQQIAYYRKIIKNDEAFALACTLILGYRTQLDPDTLAIYSKTGTIHALSVSGMHVGIIYMVLHWILGFLDRQKKLKIIKIVLICLFIWSYAILTGLSPSVLRSVIMLSVYVVAKSFRQNTNSYNVLAFTAFCLLCYDPFLIWDIGFQLSFLAVLGLIYLQPKIYKWLFFKFKFMDHLWSAITLSLAAQIATFPLSIYYFHQFPIYFLMSNLFILIPISLLMYLGIIILIFKTQFLAPLFEWIIVFMNNGLKWIASLPLSSISAIWISKIELILLSISLILCLYALVNFNKRALILSLLSLLIFQSVNSIQQLRVFAQREIIFFTLNRNYAAAFVYGSSAVLLSDLEPQDKSFHLVIQPTLAQKGIKNIHAFNWNTDTLIAPFFKKEQQIYFYQYKILLVDHRLDPTKISKPTVFSAIWLHNNPKVNIATLPQILSFKTLIIDASNKDFNIDLYRREANKIKLQNHVLKKNKAYLVDLNKLTK